MAERRGELLERERVGGVEALAHAARLGEGRVRRRVRGARHAEARVCAKQTRRQIALCRPNLLSEVRAARAAAPSSRLMYSGSRMRVGSLRAWRAISGLSASGLHGTLGSLEVTTASVSLRGLAQSSSWMISGRPSSFGVDSPAPMLFLSEVLVPGTLAVVQVFFNLPKPNLMG